MVSLAKGQPINPDASLQPGSRLWRRHPQLSLKVGQLIGYAPRPCVVWCLLSLRVFGNVNNKPNVNEFRTVDSLYDCLFEADGYSRKVAISGEIRKSWTIKSISCETRFSGFRKFATEPKPATNRSPTVCSWRPGTKGVRCAPLMPPSHGGAHIRQASSPNIFEPVARDDSDE